VGKTQLMLDIAEEVANQNKTVLFCSVEMSMEAILERRVAREMGISVLELREKGLNQEQRDKLINMAGYNSERSIYYMSNGAATSDIFNEAQKLKDNIGLDIIFIDYLQFLKDCWQNDRENQNVRVGKASKTLKTIANELKIPVIVASQLNRQLEHRTQEERHPTLADLRDSGNIEQDADVVFLLDRESITDKDGYVDDTTLVVKMAKNRQMGTAPAVKLKYSLKTKRYESIASPTKSQELHYKQEEESLL
jgi:replicative DNA helicase